MCGFVALLHGQKVLDSTVLERMRDRLSHRGPDDAGLWQQQIGEQGSVNLGFRRLSILDVSDASNQPMVLRDGALAMVYNGEIYNYLELRTELEAKGCSFRTTGDTEVLLKAYEHWGDEVLSKLNGMFAFVIWDAERGSALVGRDRFGEKPLYMARTRTGGLAFASEIKALLACPEIDSALDLRTLSKVVGGHLIYGLSETVFSGVQQFPSAHAMRITLNGDIQRRWRYWVPNYGMELAGRPKRELQQMLRDHLFRSVSMRTRSDVPVTASLSGGLDSSSIVAILSDLTRRGKADIKETISARFPDDPTISEGAHIDAVLAKVRLTGRCVTPNADELARDLRTMHWHQETVVAGMSMYLEWCVMQRAAELGYKVLLDGQGADELLAGYQVHFWAHQIDQLYQLGRYQTGKMTRKRDKLLMREAMRYDQACRRFAPRDSIPEDKVESTTLGLLNNYFKYDTEELMPGIGSSMLHRELAFNLLYSSLPSNVFSGDRNAMAHSIEARYPFLDYQLVDFCTQLPASALIDDGWQKKIMRDAMKNYLPKSILWRVDKVGFAAPQDTWIDAPAIRDWVEQRIFSGLLTELEDVDMTRIEDYWTKQQSGEGDYSSFLWAWASAGEVIDMQRSGCWSGAE
ncbi:asparagine synthase (glutamine-hydrolyzing) [Roseicyclus marinus]|uniref:asparagine synthase (glutamine-hydrolyzing) n=1 Tax=Roseicyclus marinus TaxID=2161673 RepID=UPI0024105816|nr:asparagine synthase (glutamine-hydrolyzing) [Roseicyclus marinus]MDG3042462.1 asparagine synthase (glutamine-hydrolyzing) [Roseicyclus marinus]